MLIDAKEAAKILKTSVANMYCLHGRGWFDNIRGDSPQGRRKLLFDRATVLRVKRHREYQRYIHKSKGGL